MHAERLFTRVNNSEAIFNGYLWSWRLSPAVSTTNLNEVQHGTTKQSLRAGRATDDPGQDLANTTMRTTGPSVQPHTS
ncbi:uncharacterized protein SPSK_10194 [Sporothrix schenckii 1099-18]|uniref:Uncharacterized protein n=1 Tax=Sporothrix schenckii 1099-18 TaxID=1397361 RepID=A0A0F2M8X5_SPOSC|nr:uncharacterized protein SPSK_10194 [Sporothrix schenckii 1099-18]KJR85275.1 hypothetical protein SPSK_10194 [Sporothrix schenckii 1099-18]